MDHTIERLAREERQNERCRLQGAMARLTLERDRFRLERDMLALNPGKGTRVVVVMGVDGNVADVVWPESQTGTERPLIFPKWYEPTPDAAENKET